MRSTPTCAAVVALAVFAGTIAARGDTGASSPARIKLEDFKKEHDADKLLVIDVRGADSYRAGHIPGAVNVPLADWSEHIARLKASKKPIVAYCA
jgi:rhodanese-related sulfurtransferase